MKTILVVYSNCHVSKKDANKMKHYAFNTDSDNVPPVGSMLKSPDYDTNMVVIKVLPRSFKYYNMATGELSDDFTSTAQREIRTMEIVEENPVVVYASIIQEDK